MLRFTCIAVLFALLRAGASAHAQSAAADVRSAPAATRQIAAQPAASTPATAPSSQPTTASATQPSDPARQAKAQRLFAFLEQEYAILLGKNKDRVSRSLVAISLSRLPVSRVNDTLLEMARKENDELVRAVAWEALIGRGKLLSKEQYQQLLDLTEGMLQKNALRGRLRVAAADLLSVSPPDKRTKAMFAQIFALADSRLPGDDRVIDALGHCLAAWRSPDVVENLLRRMENLDETFRAAGVLYAAGSPEPPVMAEYAQMRTRDVQADVLGAYREWWRREKPQWKEVVVGPGAEPWRKLLPHLLPAPIDLDPVDPDDKVWRRDLELRSPSLRSFDAAFIVDATGSMWPALAWLHRDLKAIMSGLGTLALEPRVSLTFYRDHNPTDEFVVRHFGLTHRLDLLLPYLQNMRAIGGGDIEEAVADGLRECARKNLWSQHPASRKVMILVADAPPHRDTQAACEAMAKEAADRGFRLYVVKTLSSQAATDLSSLDAMARAGNGVSLAANATELSNARHRQNMMEYVYRPMFLRGEWAVDEPGLQIAKARAARGADVGLGGVFAPGGGGAGGAAAEPRTGQGDGADHATGADPLLGARVLSAILVDAINPQFADRVEPMAAVLWEILQEPSVEKQPIVHQAPENRGGRGGRGPRTVRPRGPQG